MIPPHWHFEAPRPVPLTQAIRSNRFDVIALLLEHGAMLEYDDYVLTTAVCVAARSGKSTALEMLLEHGFDVNYRQADDKTVLFAAILAKQPKLVELLLSRGAIVNVFADCKTKWMRYYMFGETDRYSPLQAALISFSDISGDVLCSNQATRSRDDASAHFAAHLAILKLLVPRCDNFEIMLLSTEYFPVHQIEPCVVQFFQAELRLGWDDDLTTTKYLLRNGAVAKFSQFYDCLFEITTSFKPITTSFLQLLLLSGCKFDNITEMKTKERTCNQLWFDEHIQPVLDNVDELLSQPLSLQELSVMAIRQSIGSRQLWAKIYSLSVPPSFKDMIQLKTYNPDKNTRHYMFFNAYDPRPWDRLPVCLLGEHTL